MSQQPEEPAELRQEETVRRCPKCDTVVATAEQTHCLMCGASLAAETEPREVSTPAPISAKAGAPAAAVAEPAAELFPDVVLSVMRERQSRLTSWFTLMIAGAIVLLGALVLRFQDPNAAIALLPTESPLPPTPTFTPTWTPLPAEAAVPSEVPSIAPTPTPTETPQPPRPHRVSAGETLIGLALRYRVSVESIAQASGIDPDSPIQTGLTLLIPWPTATPPLVSVAVTVRGVMIVADPAGCDRHDVQGGDSLSRIAAQHDIDLELLIRVNRMTLDTLLQPGDSLCIPKIIIGGTLPPTAGPSPTPSLTPAPPGPSLLYPVANAVIEPPDGIVTLQWAAVKDLLPAEWYMVEVTDLDEIDNLPYRGFTRDTAFQLPGSWRPPITEDHRFRWRVSIVQVTGSRADGGKIYTYGGESSRDAFFTWQGAEPTRTPTPSPPTSPSP